MKIYLAKLSAIFLISSLICLIAYSLVRPWRTNVGNDVSGYVEAQRFLTPPGSGLGKLLIAPFFRHHSMDTVYAFEIKPVYMVAYNLWGVFHHMAGPDRESFFNFTLFTYGLLAAMIIFFVNRLGTFPMAILASLWLSLSSWALVYLYFAAYLEFSIVLFLLSLLLVLQRQKTACFFSGVLAALALLSNNAMIIYFPGVMMVIAASWLPNVRKSFAFSSVYCLGILSVFVFFEILNCTGIPAKIMGFPDLDSPHKMLLFYYQRAFFHNHFMLRGMPVIPKQYGLLFSILRYQSWTVLILCAILPVIFLVEVVRLGWRRSTAVPELRRVAFLWCPALTGLIAMDLYFGTQYGRAYYIGYVLLVIGGIIFWGYLQKNSKPLRKVGILLLVLYLCESVQGLAHQRDAFHGLNRIVKSYSQQQKKISVLDEDLHAGLMRHDLDRDIDEKIFKVQNIWELGSLVLKEGDLYVLTGPEIETILWNFSYDPFRPLQKGTFFVRKGIRVKVGNPVKIPYWGLYPPLMFEDEYDAWRLLSRHEYDGKSYREGTGAARLWPITLEKIPDDNEITELIRKIETPSDGNIKPDFVPELLIDGIERSANAWHSQQNPQYPVLIDVKFRSEIILEKVGFQAQYAAHNFSRAPKTIIIKAGNDFDHLQEVTRLTLEYPAAGFWVFRDLPKTGKKFACYRLEILDNHGSSDFVTLQELKFYGQVATT